MAATAKPRWILAVHWAVLETNPAKGLDAPIRAVRSKIRNTTL